MRKGDIALGNVRIEEVGFVGTHHQCRTVHETAASFTPLLHLTHGEEPAEGAVVPLFADPQNVLVFRAP